MEAKYFNSSEVLIIAQNMETEGQKFYKKMAVSSIDGRAKTLFQKLADEEANHKNDFENILAPHKNQEIFDFETNNLLTHYLSELIDNGVFPADTGTSANYSLEEGLEIAIQAEANAVKFYDLTAKSCVNKEGKIALLRLRQTEEEHLAAINRLKAELG